MLQCLQNHLHKTFFSVKTMQERKLFEELQYTNVLSKKLKSVLCWLCITVLHKLGHAIVLGWRVHTRLRWNDKRVEDTKIRSQLEIATTRSNSFESLLQKGLKFPMSLQSTDWNRISHRSVGTRGERAYAPIFDKIKIVEIGKRTKTWRME